MEKYNYLDAVKEDVKEYIKNEINVKDFENRTELEEKLNEDCFLEDSITGNASGTYTFSTWDAYENLYQNLDLLAEAIELFGGSVDELRKGAEACDVIIRCYLLT